jgi:ankyrin repeat protein
VMILVVTFASLLQQCGAAGSPMEQAIRAGDVERVRAILKKEPGLLRDHARALLVQACNDRQMGIVQLLLQEGADPNETDELGLTALHWASANSAPEIVSLLVAAGARPSAQDAYGLTPLHYAAQMRARSEVIRSLVTLGADPNARTFSDPAGQAKVIWLWAVESTVGPAHPALAGATPLHLAALTDAGNVQALLSGGADVHAASRTGWTALHFAAAAGQQALMEPLLRAGADVNVPDGQGRTPLHIAAGAGYVDAARRLVNAGALIDVRDSSGRTPADLASAGGHSAVLRLLVGKAP